MKLRGWLVNKRDVADLFYYIREANRDRWRRFKMKIFRDSSQFTVIRTKEISGMADRMRVPKDLRHLLDEPQQFFETLERVGHVPLPPYIHRPDTAGDKDRYQTVYATERGSGLAAR